MSSCAVTDNSSWLSDGTKIQLVCLLMFFAVSSCAFVICWYICNDKSRKNNSYNLNCDNKNDRSWTYFLEFLLDNNS